MPPRHGLTRVNTGYPAPPYDGWFYTKAAIAKMDRMLRRYEVVGEREVPRAEPRLSVSESRQRIKDQDWMRRPRKAETDAT